MYLCDYIDSPFILGLVKPKIYLPSALHTEDTRYVLAHERAHLTRWDHWWKPLGFVLLAVYWFNPVLWAAYVLLCRDIELACDERVVKDMASADKKAYSQALLNCSVPRHMIAACPLAFGEVGVKERVKSVLNYKKPTIWITLLAIAAVIIIAACFLTNPKADDASGAPDEARQQISNPAATQTQEDSDLESLELCKSALAEFQNSNSFYVFCVSRNNDENILNSYSYTKYWRNGDDWLRITEIEEALETKYEVRCQQEQYEASINEYYPQDEGEMEWTESTTDNSIFLEEWLHSFDFEASGAVPKFEEQTETLHTVTFVLDQGAYIADYMNDPTFELTLILEQDNHLQSVIYSSKYTNSNGYPGTITATLVFNSYNPYAIQPEIEKMYQSAIGG